MNLYEPRQRADSMRVVRKNTIAIAEDIRDALKRVITRDALRIVRNVKES